MIKEKTLPVFRAKSNNSYILTDEIDGISYLFFPFLGIRGLKGQMPTINRRNDILLGRCSIIDNSPDLIELIKITDGK